MKAIFVFFIAVVCGVTAMAQTVDTSFITVNQEPGALQKQQVVDRYDAAFSTLEPTRWLFKLNLSALSGSRNDLVRASAEVKLIPAISLHGSYGIGYGLSTKGLSPYNDLDLTTSVINHRFGLESRWYYDMPRRIRQGKSANNMSGNYVGFEAVYALSKFSTNQFTGETVTNDQQTFALRYGVQRRLFRYGFLDIGFGVGILKNQRSNTPADTHPWDVFANSQIGLGLALARPKTSATAQGYCDVLRCFREERQMWKVDLYNLVRVNDFQNYKGALSIGYERKLGVSPFSVEAEGNASAGHLYDIYNQADAYEVTAKNNSYGASLTTRYYYSQKRRIAQGKSGNNLAGVYFGAKFNWLEENSRQQGYRCGIAGCFSTKDWNTRQSAGTGLVWGIQHRLFEHGFIDFTMGNTVNWVTDTRRDLIHNTTRKTTDFLWYNLIFNLRAGLAF